MSDHLFGSLTMPPDLYQIVDFHRFHVDQGRGFASMFEGWRAFLAHQRSTGPMALMSSGCEHLEHFGDQTLHVVHELLLSPFDEVVSLGLAIQSLLDLPPADYDRDGQPGWLLDIESRRAVRASMRDESPHGGPTPWVVELDFGRETTSCMNVWINSDGSPYQLYPADEPIEEVEAFLGDINHLVPNRSFTRLQPTEVLNRFRISADCTETETGDRVMLQWLLRTPAASTP